MKKESFIRIFSSFSGLVLALLLVGCASVTVTENSPSLVTVQNSGCFLFGGIPLFSGDPDYPNKEVCNWFENTVHLETNTRLLNEAAAQRGARGYRTVVSHIDRESILWFILNRRVCRTSAELIRD